MIKQKGQKKIKRILSTIYICILIIAHIPITSDAKPVAPNQVQAPAKPEPTKPEPTKPEDDEDDKEDDEDNEDTEDDEDEDEEDDEDEDEEDEEDEEDDEDNEDDDEDDDEDDEDEEPEEPPLYDDDYVYEDALKASYIVSEFVRPFESDFNSVVSNDTMKKAVPALINSKTDAPHRINYRPLLAKTKNGAYVRAKVGDLFRINTGTDNNFYIQYEYEKEDDEGNKYMVQDYKKVFYSNPYSYFYVSMFVGYIDDLAQRFEQSVGKPVLVDQYGNIVIDGTSDGRLDKFMVVPNVANPCLNTEFKYFLPNRMFMSKYNTYYLNKMAGYSNLKYDKFEKQLGDVLPSYSISMYDLASTTRISVSDILNLENTPYMKNTLNIPKASTERVLSSYYMSPEFQGYLNVKDGDYSNTESSDTLLFVFGTEYEGLFLNTFQSDYIGYGNLSEIATNGFGKYNSSFALLSKDGIDLGRNWGFESHTVSLEGMIDGDDCGSWTFYTHDIGDTNGGETINNKASWGGSINPKEISLVTLMLETYLTEIDIEMLKVMATQSTGVTFDDGLSSSDLVGDDSEQAAKQKVNSVIDIMYHMLTNVGSSLSAIGTSRMSKEYSNISNQMDENFLFHTNNILKDDGFLKLIFIYVNIIIWFNALAFIIRALGLLKGDGVDLAVYVKRCVQSIFLSSLPILILSFYIVCSNYITSFVFNDTFTYWSLASMDTINTLSDSQRDFSIKETAFFRELGTVSQKNNGAVQMYGTGENLTEKVELIQIANEMLTRGVSDGDTKESIMANTDKYDQSVFFYFYDTLRYHYYSYYETYISGGNIPDWEEPLGLTKTHNNFLAMIGDPQFLWGESYSSSGIQDFSQVNYADLKKLKVQDIGGLTNLFSNTDVATRSSYYRDIQYSRWVALMSSSKMFRDMDGKYNMELDKTLPDNYNGGIIYATDGATDYVYSDFELSLIEVNKKCALELQKLQDYSRYTDESLMIIAAMDMAMVFNEEMNSYLKPEVDLVPVTFDSSSYSLDTIFRSVYLKGTDEESILNGDLMLYVESHGGVIIQALILVTMWLGQFAGIIGFLSAIVLFLLACVVFVIVYNLWPDFFNKAWLGLIGLFLCLLLIHFAFLGLVNLICVPAYSIIRESIFKSYSGGLKVAGLFIMLCVRSAAIVMVVVFAFKYYRDLGGEIIHGHISNLISNVSGLLGHKGPMDSKSNSTTMNSEQTEINSNKSDTEISEADIDEVSNPDGAVGESKSEAEDAVKGRNIKSEKTEEKDSETAVVDSSTDEANSVVADRGVISGASADSVSAKEASAESVNLNAQIDNSSQVMSDGNKGSTDKETVEVTKSESKDHDNVEVSNSSNETSATVSEGGARAESHNSTTDNLVNSKDINNTQTNNDSKTVQGGGKVKGSKGADDLASIELDDIDSSMVSDSGTSTATSTNGSLDNSVNAALKKLQQVMSSAEKIKSSDVFNSAKTSKEEDNNL